MNIKLTGAAFAAVLSMAALTACGGNDSNSSGSYCGDLKAATVQLSGINDVQTLDQAKFDTLHSAVHNIAGEAPADVKSSWALLDNQFTLLDNALKDAGLSFDDFSALTQGQTPSGVDPAKLAALTKKLSSVDSAGLSAATTKIQNEAKSECNITIAD